MSRGILLLGEQFNLSPLLKNTLPHLSDQQEFLNPEIEDVPPELLENATLILLDQPEFLDFIRSVPAKMRSELSSKTVLFADLEFPADYHHLFNLGEMFQVISSQLLNDPKMISVLLKHISNRTCAATSDWLQNSTPLGSFSIKARSEKSALLNKMGEILTASSLPERQVQEILNVSDELLMNALFNAPADRNGVPINRSLPRNTDVVLEDNQAVTVQLGHTDMHLLLSVKDPFGSLSKEHLKRSLQRAMNKGVSQLRKGEPGAGIGIYCAWSMMSHLHIDLLSEAFTQVAALFPLEQRSHVSMRTYRGFSLINAEK